MSVPSGMQYVVAKQDGVHLELFRADRSRTKLFAVARWQIDGHEGAEMLMVSYVMNEMLDEVLPLLDALDFQPDTRERWVLRVVDKALRAAGFTRVGMPGTYHEHLYPLDKEI